MPEPLDRETFLRAVAEAVDLQPAEVGEVLEELSAHLSDSAQCWRDAGYDPDDAERRAIRALGNPVMLGREMADARHRRRDLLSAVGGGVFSALSFGLWSWVFVWVFFGGLTVIGGALAIVALDAWGHPYGDVLAGRSGSIATVVITGTWLAWLGWILPARVARRARRSVPGVRRVVGWVGFAVLTLAIWAGLRLTLDPVLAVGLPLSPFAFLLASQRPSLDLLVFPPTTGKARLVAIAAIVVAIAALGVATAGPPYEDSAGWVADTSGIGAPETAVPELARIDRSGDSGYSASSRDLQTVEQSVRIGDGAQAAAFARIFATLRLEAWPATVQGDRLVFGPAPMAATSTRVTEGSQSWGLTMALPMERQPTSVATLLVGIEPDGNRVILAGPDYPIPTSPWQGTVLDWWFGQH